MKLTQNKLLLLLEFLAIAVLSFLCVSYFKNGSNVFSLILILFVVIIAIDDKLSTYVSYGYSRGFLIPGAVILVYLFQNEYYKIEGMENKENTIDKQNNLKNKNLVNKNKIQNKMNSMNEEGMTTSEESVDLNKKKGKTSQIDYAATIENAYDELNNVLGSDGIQRLTSDTQNLMKQQMKLAETMKGMTPIIKQIAPMVENLKGMMGTGTNNK